MVFICFKLYVRRLKTCMYDIDIFLTMTMYLVVPLIEGLRKVWELSISLEMMLQAWVVARRYSILKQRKQS